MEQLTQGSQEVTGDGAREENGVEVKRVGEGKPVVTRGQGRDKLGDWA